MKDIRTIVLAALAVLPCAVRASIADQLIVLESTRVAITNAVAEKGGTASGALTNVPSEILSIPVGGEVDDLKGGTVFIDGIEFAGYTNTLSYGAFYGLSGVQVVTGNIVCVENYAMFGMSSIKDVRLPRLRVIYEKAFSSLSNMTNFEAQNLLILEPQTFIGCSSMKRYCFPSLKAISGCPFWTQTLDEVDVPNATMIYSGAFQYGDIKDIQLTNSPFALKSFDNKPWGCTSTNTTFHFSDGDYKKVDGAWTFISK